MRYFEPREAYSYEKRGQNFYGFCEADSEQACKVIVRPNMRSLRDAMQKHYAMTHGRARQLLLDVPSSELPDVPPF